MIRFIPFFVLSEHRIQDSQQFAHNRQPERLFWLFLPQQDACKTGLKRVATSVAMYSAVRTPALPPKIVRRPLIVPESRFTGATPTSALISRLESRPSSGTSANSAATVMMPTPLI